MLTLELLLRREDDATLLDIQTELIEGVVPATGYAHAYCRKVNRMIDQGKLQTNNTGYRKVYMPTLAKAVQRELACRYVEYLRGGKY